MNDLTQRGILNALNDVASSVATALSSSDNAGSMARGVSDDNNAAALGSLVSAASLNQHASVAIIRPDLPMLLPTVRLLIGILSGPKNIDRRNEVRVCAAAEAYGSV
jgi:hypothetical protein